MKSKIVLFVFSFMIWMLLGWSLDLQHILIGLPVAFLVSFLMGDLFVHRLEVIFQPSRYFWFIYFIPLFIWQWFKASLNMIMIVLSSSSSIKPGIIKIKTNLKSDLGLTFLANAITLMPGMLCVDIKPERGTLYVHWINIELVQVEKKTVSTVRQFENVLTKIFE